VSEPTMNPGDIVSSEQTCFIWKNFDTEMNNGMGPAVVEIPPNSPCLVIAAFSEPDAQNTRDPDLNRRRIFIMGFASNHMCMGWTWSDWFEIVE
jgi:hypothetical protein